MAHCLGEEVGLVVREMETLGMAVGFSLLSILVVKVPVIEMRMQEGYWAHQKKRSLVLDVLSLRHLLVIQVKMTFCSPVCVTNSSRLKVMDILPAPNREASH